MRTTKRQLWRGTGPRFLVILAAAVMCGSTPANDRLGLIRQFCTDCHGAPDESPKGDFSLTAEFDSLSLHQSGPALKKALDAVESYEMPPADGDQPTQEERRQLIAGIRKWLSRPTLDDQRDPGHPVLRRLTRLEYNNTVRDLLGLETDVIMFSERLPFERTHYQPRSNKMPERVTMAAREYGAKYPVLLPDSSLPGDSRAEHGFANRGDAQNLSAVRLQQYVRLAGEIAFHPELLSRAERMEELLPNARFRQMATAKLSSKPLATSKVQLATNNNVVRTAKGSAFDLDVFQKRVEIAFAEDRGGVFTGDELPNTRIAGTGGKLRIAYGRTARRVFAINPDEEWWFAPFATAIESSGDTLFANYEKRQRRYELHFEGGGAGRFAGIAELGVVVLSRRGEEGLVRLEAVFSDDEREQVEVTLMPGAGVDNTFVSFAPNERRRVKRLIVDGSRFSGDYVLLDDLAFVTYDTPNRQPLVQAEEPVLFRSDAEERPEANINRALATASPAERIAHFLRRAFRRDVVSAEVDAYLRLYQTEISQGGDDESAMRAIIQGILSSPSFLYLGCSDSSPLSFSNEDDKPTDFLIDESRPQKKAPTSRSTPKVLPLSDYDLASRLSYFLWSSMPDDELLQLAKDGGLQNDVALENQACRMLADRRSIELAESFYVQWLRLPELWSAQPDKELFPGFYSDINDKRTLAQDMFGEALLLFQTILVEDRPVTDLLDSDYTFINGKLAQLYGRSHEQLQKFSDGTNVSVLDLEEDRVWSRVRKFDPQRGGIITSPAVLTLTSFPHRTSSIRRGVWILDTLFNRHPPAPKVAVADIDEQEDTEHLTQREKVELHRAQPACAACHDRIDPPGFALENFDAIGRWREKDGDELIDASGELPGVGNFANPEEFRSALMSKRRRFVQGLAEHLFSFAIGRKLEYFDTPAIEQIVERTIDDDYRISRMIVEITKSYPFRFGVRDLSQ